MVVAILTICLIILFFSSLILRHIYRKKNHLPTGECACCKKANASKIYKEYRKKYPLIKN